MNENHSHQIIDTHTRLDEKEEKETEGERERMTSWYVRIQTITIGMNIITYIRSEKRNEEEQKKGTIHFT